MNYLPKRPLVSIIISSYNSRDFLKECLTSLKMSSYDNFEVIVVDAGSTDGTAEIVKEKFPDVKLIRAGRIGIGAAINIGLKKAIGEIIIFDLNSDDIVHKDWLLNLVMALRQHNYDVIACGKRYIFGTNCIDSAGAKVNMLIGSFPPIGRGKHDGPEFDIGSEVDYVPVIATSRKVIEKVGFCDEIFEIYFEDTDFCFRAKKKGVKVIYVPEAKFYHHGSSTIGKVSRKKIYYMFRNRLYFIIKNFPLPFMLSSILLTPFWFLSEFFGQCKTNNLSSNCFVSISNISACLEAIKWTIVNFRKIIAIRKIFLDRNYV